MRRSLQLELESCDALHGLLRINAAAEVQRWPAHLSGGLAMAIEHEMARLESTVRTLGECYECLEAHGVATIDRAPLSRFSDVDGAFHLVACPISVDVDLEPARVALDRGDVETRAAAATLAVALRTLIASIARSELLVCRRLVLGGAEQPPDRVLRFVDAYLAPAWANSEAPDPALPSMLPVAVAYDPTAVRAAVDIELVEEVLNPELFHLETSPGHLPEES